MATERTLTAAGLLTLAFLAQLFGHLLLKYYMPNPAVGGLGFVFIGMIFYYVLYVRNDPFGFLLIVYICSHFSYADNQGGLWNLMTFGMLGIYKLMGRGGGDFRKPDHAMSALLAILILSNVLGWALKNPVPIVEILQGIAVFFGFLLMFGLASNVEITDKRLRLFLTVTFFMLSYQLVVALNQHYALVRWNSPLLGSYAETGSLIVSNIGNALGTLSHSELFGEYGVVMTCLLVPMLSSSLIQKQIKFGSNRIVFMILCCLAIVMLTLHRSTTILFVLVVIVYYLIFMMHIFSAIDKVGRQLKLVLVVAILLPVAGSYVGLQGIESKFSRLSGESFSVESVLSGKSINRGELITMGLNRLQDESWWIGYGFGVPRSNVWAWFGIDPQKRLTGMSDLHSLYLSLPELYGWIGSLAFLAMIVITMFRSFSASLRYRKRKNILVILAAGFAMVWCVILMNEYKISLLRNPNYHMIFWIWLGLANSVVKTIRAEGRGRNASVLTAPGRTNGASSA